MSLRFGGIEAANPLGFLAGIGALRIANTIWPGTVRLRWIREGGWRPELSAAGVEDEDGFCRALAERGGWAPLDEFARLGGNITVAPSDFAAVVKEAVARATAEDRRAADFAAAFGCEVIEEKDKGRIEYTDLCFITGSGHQDFLGTVRTLARCACPEHLKEALFGPWRYADKGLSLRWDPGDAKEYALRWRNPSVGGVSGVWGANRLAFEALALFPTLPGAARLRTTGFATRGRAHEFTWPVWSQWAGVDTARSLLGLLQLQDEEPDRRELAAMGVEEVFRARRVRIGMGANFKVCFRPARPV